MKASKRAIALMEERDDIWHDLVDRMRNKTLHIPIHGGDLLHLQRLVHLGTRCPCDDCHRARLVLQASMLQLTFDDLDLDRIRLEMNPNDRWHPRVMLAGSRFEATFAKPREGRGE